MEQKTIFGMKPAIVIMIFLGAVALGGVGGSILGNSGSSSYFAAAERGDAEAQFKLANMYFSGQGGVVKNQEEAVKWLLKSANQGHEAAALALAICYSEGRGVPKNKVEADKWAQKAMEKSWGKVADKINADAAKLAPNPHR